MIQIITSVINTNLDSGKVYSGMMRNEVVRPYSKDFDYFIKIIFFARTWPFDFNM